MHTVVKVHKVYGRLGDDQLCDIFRSTEQYESGQLAGNDGANHYKYARPNKNTFKRTCSTRNTDRYDHEEACLNNALCNEAATIKRGGGGDLNEKKTHTTVLLWLMVKCDVQTSATYIVHLYGLSPVLFVGSQLFAEKSHRELNLSFKHSKRV